MKNPESNPSPQARKSLPGTVYLVGAGPGDPDLITVRGLKLLKTATVVVHDRLINSALISEIDAQARIIDVGKSPGGHTITQEEISALLVDYALAGETVVRLKGGDPFIFGRGGEEGIALAHAGVPFQIIPGITSAISVPAAAGIPLLFRGVARSFAVVTGQTEHADEEVDWGVFVEIDTLVILMWLRRISTITTKLIAHGLDGDTPCAVIARGTTPHQQVVTASLFTIAGKASTLDTPAIIVVGQVVALRQNLDWFSADAQPSTHFPLQSIRP